MTTADKTRATRTVDEWRLGTSKTPYFLSVICTVTTTDRFTTAEDARYIIRLPTRRAAPIKYLQRRTTGRDRWCAFLSLRRRCLVSHFLSRPHLQHDGSAGVLLSMTRSKLVFCHTFSCFPCRRSQNGNVYARPFVAFLWNSSLQQHDCTVNARGL